MHSVKTLETLESISIQNTSPPYALSLANYLFRLTLGIKDVPRDVAMYLKGCKVENHKILQTKIDGKYDSLDGLIEILKDVTDSGERSGLELGINILRLDVEKLESDLFILCTEPMFVCRGSLCGSPTDHRSRTADIGGTLSWIQCTTSSTRGREGSDPLSFCTAVRSTHV